MPLALQGIQVCTAANKPTHAFTVVLPLCRHPKRKLQRYEAYQQLRREKSHAHSTHSPPWHTLSGDCEPVRSTGSHSGTGRQCRCINRNLCTRRPGLCRSASSSATTACRTPYAICHRLMWCTHRPLADSMDHLLATIFHPDTTSTHPNAAVTCITGRHPIVAKSDGQGLQEPHNRGSWCLIEECLPWLKPYSSSTALI